jgi:hypothetical protein
VSGAGWTSGIGDNDDGLTRRGKERYAAALDRHEPDERPFERARTVLLYGGTR